MSQALVYLIVPIFLGSDPVRRTNKQLKERRWISYPIKIFQSNGGFEHQICYHRIHIPSPYPLSQDTLPETNISLFILNKFKLVFVSVKQFLLWCWKKCLETRTCYLPPTLDRISSPGGGDAVCARVECFTSSASWLAPCLIPAASWCEHFAQLFPQWGETRLSEHNKQTRCPSFHKQRPYCVHSLRRHWTKHCFCSLLVNRTFCFTNERFVFN